MKEDELVKLLRIMAILAVVVGFVLIAMSGMLQDAIGLVFGGALVAGGAAVVWKV